MPEKSIISGTAILLPDNVRSGMIVPIVCRGSFNREEFKTHCFKTFDRSLKGRIAHGDIIVAGKNFAKGETGEETAMALMGMRLSAVVAVSVNRIFLRNSINLGFPIIILPAALEMIEDGDHLDVDPFESIVRNRTQGLAARGKMLPDTFLRILEAGDIVSYVKANLEKEK